MNNRSDSTRDALYAAILAYPDEDTPRLVYADYIEEQGETACAEFIRLQCQLGQMNEWDAGYTATDVRCRRLIAEYPEWAEPFRRVSTPVSGSPCSLSRHVDIRRSHSVFVRGFPGVAAISTDWFAKNHTELFAQFPIESAGFAMDCAEWREALSNCPGLAQLKGLGISMWGDEREGLESLAKLRHIDRLKSLEVYSEAVVTDPFQHLLEAPQFAGLEAFSLRSDCGTYDPRQPEDVVYDLDRSSWLFGLRELAVCGDIFEGLGQRLARETGWMPRLKQLGLLGHMGHYGQIPQERVARVADGVRSGWFAAVEVLDLGLCDFEGLVLDSLSESGAAKPLKLTLPSRRRSSYHEGLEARAGLLQSDWLADLYSLEIGGPTTAEIEEIIESTLPSRLRILELQGRALTGGRLRALLDVPGGWPNLERLNLTGNPIPEGALKEFVALAERFPRLISFAAGNGEPSPQFLYRLADSPHAARLRELLLNIPLDDAAADALSRSPVLGDIDLLQVVEGSANRKSLDRLKERFDARLTIISNIAQ
jgi:uncharacterized protein (TIGR02996 family)